MKKILVSFLVLTLILLSGCNDQATESNGASSEDNRKSLALVYESVITDDSSEISSVYKACKRYNEQIGNEFRHYVPQDYQYENLLNTLNNAVVDGYDAVAFYGDGYADFVSSVAGEFPNITFILFGTIKEISPHVNIYCCDGTTDKNAFLEQVLL